LRESRLLAASKPTRVTIIGRAEDGRDEVVVGVKHEMGREKGCESEEMVAVGGDAPRVGETRWWWV
jgi:hypothetical protein